MFDDVLRHERHHRNTLSLCNDMVFRSSMVFCRQGSAAINILECRLGAHPQINKTRIEGGRRTGAVPSISLAYVLGFSYLGHTTSFIIRGGGRCGSKTAFRAAP